MIKSITKLKKQCEKCLAYYATGKDYGSYWVQSDLFDQLKELPKQGLCEFCNPNSIWYIK